MSRDCHVESISDDEDHDDNMYHVPMTCMVLEICDKRHKSDFSTLIVWGTVVTAALVLCSSYLSVSPLLF